MSHGRTLIKTQDYLDIFARFKQKENIEAVERMLTSHTELELFERSQLGRLDTNMCYRRHVPKTGLDANLGIQEACAVRALRRPKL